MNKVRLQYTKEYGGPNKGRIKNEKYLEMSFFVQVRLVFTRRELGHGGVRNETRMHFHIPLFRQREKGWAVYPQATPLEQGLGLERRSWAMPFSLPAHFCPAAKRERQRGEREAGKEIMKSQNMCLHAPSKDMKSTWNLHESGLRFALRQNHGGWLATRRGAVTWTVDYMSSHLTVGLGAASGERSRDRQRNKLG